MLFPYFVYIAHFIQFTRGIFLLFKKSFLWINQRRKKVLGKKKEKKKRKRKKTLSNKDVAVKPKFAIHNIKNEVSYF